MSFLNLSDEDLDRYLSELSPEDLALLEDDTQPVPLQKQSSKLNLYDVLESCIQARGLIKSEQAKIKVLIKAATAPDERAFREYQHDLVNWVLTRTADAAELRMRHIRKLDKDVDLQQKELALCADGAKGALHWFEYYAWGFDPTADVPISFMPLVPFDFQRKFIKWLEETVFLYRTGGLVEKARKMGATLCTVDWFVCKWRFVPGFIGSMVTRKEDLVDSKKKKDTLFEKARVQINLLPTWMLPAGYEARFHSSHMTIINPENQAELTGEAPTTTVGRQGRATALLADEFAHWSYDGIPQATAMSFTCKSVIKVSSVYGEHNAFYQEAHSGKSNKFVMDWHEHPWLDMRWYRGLEPGYGGAPMSKALIAQEVDRDYKASIPGRVWPMFQEPYSVITYDELKAFFHKHGLRFPDDEEDFPDGRVRMPLDWYTGRGNDRGATPAHRNGWLWSARPREHQPLWDSIFFFREWLAPIPTTYKDIADYVNTVEKPDNEGGARRLVLSLNSHEAESERQTYETEYGIVMDPWDTDYESGISQVGDFLTIKDEHLPNPFRPELMGRARLYIVTRNGQGELKRKEDGTFYVTQGTDFGGMVNLRRQVNGYHYPPEEAGKPVGQMRPEKKDDDLVDVLRAFAIEWGALIGQLTEAEKRRERLIKANPALDPDYVHKTVGWEHVSGMFALQRANEKLEKQERPEFAPTGSRVLDRRNYLKSRGAL